MRRLTKADEEPRPDRTLDSAVILGTIHRVHLGKSGESATSGTVSHREAVGGRPQADSRPVPPKADPPAVTGTPRGLKPAAQVVVKHGASVVSHN